MSRILAIDTAVDKATLCICKDGGIMGVEENKEVKDHASWLHTAVNNLLRKSGLGLKDMDAVAVSIGPGSYTGLRVGLAAAKGYCYALKIPLISLGTLEIMAHSVRSNATDLICPMIDARRMEVYTAVYDRNLIEKISPLAMILHSNSFESLLADHSILFCGNGANKFRPLLMNSNASFTEQDSTAESLGALAYMALQNKNFTDIAYSEPLYLKDFQSSTRRQ